MSNLPAQILPRKMLLLKALANALLMSSQTSVSAALIEVACVVIVTYAIASIWCRAILHGRFAEGYLHQVCLMCSVSYAHKCTVVPVTMLHAMRGCKRSYVACQESQPC